MLERHQTGTPRSQHALYASEIFRNMEGEDCLPNERERAGGRLRENERVKGAPAKQTNWEGQHLPRLQGGSVECRHPDLLVFFILTRHKTVLKTVLLWNSSSELSRGSLLDYGLQFGSNETFMYSYYGLSIDYFHQRP